MNSVADDIRALIESNTSLVLGTDLFVGIQPDTPSNCITVADTPGMPREYTMTPGTEYYKPSVQIRSRNVTYLGGYTALFDVLAILEGLAHFDLSGSTYELIHVSAEPAFLGQDDKGNSLFAATFNIQRTET